MYANEGFEGSYVGSVDKLCSDARPPIDTEPVIRLCSPASFLTERALAKVDVDVDVDVDGGGAGNGRCCSARPYETVRDPSARESLSDGGCG